MKTPMMVSTCAALLFSAVDTRAACVAAALDEPEASVEQQDQSPKPSANNDMPKSIACSQERGESLGQCTYSIRSDETGKTTITVAFANGFKRKLFFRNGKFLKASTTMSGTGTDTDWNLKDGMHSIRVDDQRYEVPDTLLASE